MGDDVVDPPKASKPHGASIDGLRAAAVLVALSFWASLLLFRSAWILADLFAMLGGIAAVLHGHYYARNTLERITAGLLIGLAMALIIINIS